MLVICEDCAKKYNIDESRIKGNRARFTCNECGHIIIVDKTDLGRPLVKSTTNGSQSSSSSIDLLKEMSAPLVKEGLENQGDTAEQQKQETESAPVNTAKKKKGLTIPGYFLVGGALSFVLINGGVGYILSQHYTRIPSEQMEVNSDLLLTGALVLLGTWAVSFLVLFIMGILLARKVNKLTLTITRINQGEEGLTITAKGPSELVEMSKALSELCSGNK